MKSSFLLLILLAACYPPPQGMERVTLTDSSREVTVDVEIADEPPEYAQGLMGRESLPEGRGMLFVFEDETPRAFWMKDTLIPLDILFFDAEGKLVHTARMNPCETDPCPRYSSGKPATYALEVVAGFIEKYRVGPGWRLSRR